MEIGEIGEEGGGGEYSMYLFFFCTRKIEKMDILSIRPLLYIYIIPKFDAIQPSS